MTTTTLREWVGVTADGTQVLCNGNPNPGHVPMHVSSLDEILVFGNLLKAVNRYTMQRYCRMWNDHVRKTMVSRESAKNYIVHPARAEFELRVVHDRRRRT